MMTLVEFIAPLKRSSQRDKCLVVLYYFEHYKGTPAMTVAEVRAALGQARVQGAKQMNVAQVFSGAGHHVDASETDEKGRKLWQLTGAGSSAVRSLLGLPDDQPEIAMDVSSLRSTAAKLSDGVARQYVEEALLCLRVGALRAAIVFLWSGGMRQLQNKAAVAGWPEVSAAILKHDLRAKPVKKVEDFAQVKDSVMLLAIRELGIIDKGQWTMLDAVLGLRNQSGHPSKYSPGAKKASAFIEDLIGIAFA
jgi:hypothetical protein